jgi:PAT family acetyl-CoA transporter-like MFS transporter 1
MEVRNRLENKQIEDEPLAEDASSSDSESERSPASIPSDWRKDRLNICLLLFLYLLQGIPLGLAASIPLIIQTYGASWSQQATFSFAFWPFSLKLLWAPIVDALYFKRFGRRKTWLIPIQFGIGLVMIILSYYINDILLAPATSPTSSHPRMFRTLEFMRSSFGFCLDIYFLTAIFFGLSFLAATQDICVDGWALSILSR